MQAFVLYAIAAMVFIGRLLIVPRLATVPSLEGTYEALSHIIVGALLFAPIYDWKQRLGPSRIYGVIGCVISLWELIMFLLQRFA